MTDDPLTRVAACVIEGCTRKPIARGLCPADYSAARRAGKLATYQGARTMPREQRFWSLVEKTDGCWHWLGDREVAGYGRFTFGGKLTKAHRAAWELTRGPIPADKVIDHLCRVRHCVNPDHMEVVTQHTNWERGFSFTAVYARKTHCAQGHEFTPQTTYIYPATGQRVCRPCHNEANRQFRLRRRGTVAP